MLVAIKLVNQLDEKCLDYTDISYYKQNYVGINRRILASRNKTQNATNICSPRIHVQIHNQLTHRIFKCLIRIHLGGIGHRKTSVYIGKHNTEEDTYMILTRFETQIVDLERPLGRLMQL
jgi:hypothetical protein